MPVLIDRALDMARRMKAFLNPEGGATRGTLEDAAQHENLAEGSMESAGRRPTSERRERIESKRRELRSKKQELREIRSEANAARHGPEGIEHKKRKKRAQQEVFLLERELRAAMEGQAESEPVTGALPDFVIIGTQKGGTSYLYHLLTQHPLVEPAPAKELHFFDSHFDLGVEWYRSCFPRPRLKDGRTTITGEATPYYLFHPDAAGRMAQVVPQARLIALLRDPVDRAYSHYQQAVGQGHETLQFEEAIAAEEARLGGDRDMMLEGERFASYDHQQFSYLSRSVYVDQLQRWTELFPREQLLILKSEDCFESPQQTLKPVLNFLGLPDWEPEASEIVPRMRNQGSYERGMDPATRRRLEEYFEPHNRRLYEHLGVDFGW